MKRSIQLTDMKNDPVLLNAAEVSSVSTTCHVPNGYLSPCGAMPMETSLVLDSMKRLPTLVTLKNGESFCVSNTFADVVSRLAQAFEPPVDQGFGVKG